MLFDYPTKARFGRMLPKSKIYENANVNTKIKDKFVNQIKKIEEFEAFYIANVGNELGYTDSLAVEWRVRILNNPLESTTTSGTGNCQLHSFTLQMRAELVGDIPDKALIDDVANVLVDDEGNTLVYT